MCICRRSVAAFVDLLKNIDPVSGAMLIKEILAQCQIRYNHYGQAPRIPLDNIPDNKDIIAHYLAFLHQLLVHEYNDEYGARSAAAGATVQFSSAESIPFLIQAFVKYENEGALRALFDFKNPVKLREYLKWHKMPAQARFLLIMTLAALKDKTATEEMGYIAKYPACVAWHELLSRHQKETRKSLAETCSYFLPSRWVYVFGSDKQMTNVFSEMHEETLKALTKKDRIPRESKFPKPGSTEFDWHGWTNQKIKE